MNQNMKQIPSFEFRRWALAVIKPVMSVLVVVALITVLPELISTTVIRVTEADPNNYTQPVLDKMTEYIAGVDPALLTGESLVTDPEAEIPAEDLQAWLAELDAVAAESEALMNELDTAVKTFFAEKGAIYIGMNAMYLLLSPVLAITLTHALLNAVRKREVTLADSMAMLRYTPKALLVELWVFLRMYAWMLPGMAVMLLGLLLSYLLPQLVMVSLLLLFAGLIVSLVLGIRAGLHYALAPIALADDPSLSPNACVRISWQIMRRRKMEFFMLQLSFIGWELLIALVALMIASMFGFVIGDTLSMMGSLLLSVYISAAQVCFFLAYSGKLNVQVQPDGPSDGAQDDTFVS